MNTAIKLEQRLRGRSMSDQIYQTILSMILTLEIKPREQLSEAQLSKDFSVSRTPVREAFQKLAALGFLDIVPQRGTIVAPMRVSAFRKSQFMREAFELALVRQAVALPDNTELCRALNRQIKLQEVYSELGDKKAFFDSDEAFHQAIAENCGLPDLWPEVQRVKVHMDRVRYVIKSQHETPEVLSQHRAIAQAICARDETAALTAMTTHLRRANHMIEQAAKEHPDYFELDD